MSKKNNTWSQMTRVGILKTHAVSLLWTYAVATVCRQSRFVCFVCARSGVVLLFFKQKQPFVVFVCARSSVLFTVPALRKKN